MDTDAAKDAATEIGQMINKLFKLAPIAGLFLEIKVKPAPVKKRP